MKRDAQLPADISAEPHFEPCKTRPRIGFWSVRGADAGPSLRSNDDDLMRGRIFLPLTPFCRRGDAELMHSASETLQSITEVPAGYVANPGCKRLDHLVRHGGLALAEGCRGECDAPPGGGDGRERQNRGQAGLELERGLAATRIRRIRKRGLIGACVVPPGLLCLVRGVASFRVPGLRQVFRPGRPCPAGRSARSSYRGPVCSCPPRPHPFVGQSRG